MQIMDKTTLPAVYDAKISDFFRTRHVTSAEILDKDSHLNERNYKKETILRVIYELYANSSIYLLYICIVIILEPPCFLQLYKKRKMCRDFVTFFSFLEVFFFYRQLLIQLQENLVWREYLSERHQQLPLPEPADYNAGAANQVLHQKEG